MNTIRKHKYNQEVELVLSHYIPSIKDAKTKKEADEKIYFLQYVLQMVVEKYYREK